MKAKVIIVARKKTNSSFPLAEYHPRGTRSKGKENISSAVIKIDPILNKKNNRNIKRIVIKHELDEIDARNKGHTKKESHKIAVRKEPSWFSDKFKTHNQLQKGVRK